MKKKKKNPHEWNQKILVLWKRQVLNCHWQSTTDWSCRGAGGPGETLLFGTGNETLKSGKSQMAWLLSGRWQWDVGLGSLRQSPFAVLQCCGEAHEPTSPSHDLFPLCKEEKICTRTGMFIYFGRVCFTHYLHLKLWDFYLAQYKNNNNKINPATNPKTQPTTKIHPEPKQWVWQMKHFTVHGYRRHRNTWAPSARSCLWPVQDLRAHGAPIPTAIQRAPEPAFHMKEIPWKNFFKKN